MQEIREYPLLKSQCLGENDQQVKDTEIFSLQGLCHRRTFVSQVTNKWEKCDKGDGRPVRSCIGVFLCELYPTQRRLQWCCFSTYELRTETSVFNCIRVALQHGAVFFLVARTT